MMRSRLSRARRRLVHQRSSRRGFTLISVIVAMVLLAVGISALARASSESVKAQTLAQNRTNAIAIGRAYLENIRTRDPWSITSEAAVTVNSDGTTSGSGSYVRSMAMTVIRSNLIKLDITVTFPRTTNPVLLTTYMFRGNGLSAMAGS